MIPNVRCFCNGVAGPAGRNFGIMKRIGVPEFFKATIHPTGHEWRMWGLGIVAPLFFSGLGIWGLVTGNTWWLGRSGFNHAILVEISGATAEVCSIGYLGIALALFGWNFAYETERLNPIHDWITGIGCLEALICFPWVFYLHHLAGAW